MTWKNTAGEVLTPLSVTGTAVIAVARDGLGTHLAAFSRADGSVVWTSTAARSENYAATFGGLAWALSTDNAGLPATTTATAFSAATGHRVYASAAFHDDTDPMPPVVNAGRVYLDTGSEVMCLALPGAR